jgi:hypothetical protein
VAINSEAEAGPSGPDLAFVDDRDGGTPSRRGPAAGRREEGGGRIEEVAVRRGELAVLRGAGADVVYELAVRCFLELGRPAVLVDGGCQADPYEVAAIAKRLGRDGMGTGSGEQAAGSRGDDGGRPSPAACCLLPAARSRDLVDEVLRNIHVARAFTAHQLEALIVEKLGLMVERLRPAFIGVLSLDSLFQDDQLDRFEARIMRARCLRTLRRLAKEHEVMAAATVGAAGGRPMARWW